MKYPILAFLLIASTLVGHSQCVQQVDFNTWKQTGDVAGSWLIQSGGSQLQTNANTVYPTMFVGPDTFINVRITGSFEVPTSWDNDYLGFVFGYDSPDTTWGNPFPINSADMDFYLFDWKRSQQTYLGYFAQEGFTINDVDGVYQYNTASVFPSFWSHTNSAPFNVLATDFGVTRGWNVGQTYDFELLYTPSRAVVKIDTDTIFDITGCFEPGRFGFYNYSQDNALYWNFNYELYVDFDMQAQYVCVGDTARFSFVDTSNCNSSNALSNIASFYWDFGDGSPTSTDTTPTHVYNTIDSFLVSLVATDINGCTDTNQKYIFIQGPVGPVVGHTTACLGDSVSFQDLTIPQVGSIVAWQWNFGDGSPLSTQQNPTHYYASPGSYTVQFVVQTNAGCLDTTDTVIQISDPPTPDFSFTDVCLGDSNQLMDASTPAGPILVDYFWDINDDGTVEYSNDSSISHLFSAHGTYPVELKVLDAAGCRDSVVIDVEVHPLPIPGFEATSVCYRDFNQFTDTSSVPTGVISALDWSFGDGDSASNALTTSHQFANPGLYDIVLVVTTDEGCVDSTDRTVRVYDLPHAAFSTDSVCLDKTAEFTTASVPNYGTIVSYLWSTGDGDSAHVADPEHDYNAPGLYEVNHTVVTSEGCRDTATANIRIYPLPTTVFSWTNNVCEGEELKFEEQSFVNQISPGGDSVVAWQWVFDQMDTLYGKDISYSSPTYRTLSVVLTTTSNYGCVSSFENFPQIFPIPDVDMTYDVNCEDYTSSFISNSSVATGVLSDYTWDFGDGNTAKGENVDHIFDLPGFYTVRLNVVSNKGCKDLIEKEVIVPGTPKVDFSISTSEGCSPLEVAFDNESSVSVGELRYRWYLNGQEFSGQEDPALTLRTDSLEPEGFDVTLVAISEDNCQRSFTRGDVVTVIPSPNAAFYLFSDDLNMFEPTAEFYNSSQRSIRWDWDFGDGSKSIDFAPSHIYKNSGPYDVSLVAYNEYNCENTYTRRITVEPKTTFYVPNSFTPNNDGVNDVWTPKGFNEGMPFELKVWDRWGHELFRTTNMHVGWDGTTDGSKKAPVGSYIYQINMETPEGEFKELQGTFSLIR